MKTKTIDQNIKSIYRKLAKLNNKNISIINNDNQYIITNNYTLYFINDLNEKLESGHYYYTNKIINKTYLDINKYNDMIKNISDDSLALSAVITGINLIDDINTYKLSSDQISLNINKDYLDISILLGANNFKVSDKYIFTYKDNDLISITAMIKDK